MTTRVAKAKAKVSDRRNVLSLRFSGFVVFFVLLFDGVPGEGELGLFVDDAGFGEVESFGGGFDGTDDSGGGGFEMEAAGVVAGEGQAIKQRSGSSGFETASGEGVDDAGEGELDGLAVFEGGELDVLTGDEVAARSFGLAIGAVAVVEAVMEVAPESIGEGQGLAAGSVGLDVTAKCWHVISRGGTPLLPACKLNVCRVLAGVMSAKYWQTRELRPNIRFDTGYRLKSESPGCAETFVSIYKLIIAG